MNILREYIFLSPGGRNLNGLITLCISGLILSYPIMYQSNRSFNIHPPGIWRLFLPGREGIWSLGLIRADSTWVDKSWRKRLRRQTLMNSKEKIAYLWRIGWKSKAYTSCVPYLKVFKGWGHLNSFSPRWGGNLNKNFPKIQMPGGVARRVVVEASIWLVHKLTLI